MTWPIARIAWPSSGTFISSLLGDEAGEPGRVASRAQMSIQELWFET
ncbi:MAG: hypothetical protein R2909_07905 [Gemmatimonadales bacterium]